MKLTNPLRSIGWLSGSGYQVVVDEVAKQEAELARKNMTYVMSESAEDTVPRTRAAGASH